jgi:hypothetical protein
MTLNFRGAATPLTQAGLAKVCNQLGVKAAEAWAVVFTETDPPNGGYFQSGKPQILYEQHVFHRLTGGKYDASHPDISSPHPGNYGASGEHQYARLAEAAGCDETAALMAASWGMGQTLGENFKLVKYKTVQALVADMVESEDLQLLAMGQEILNSHIASALQTHDWKNFASVYNGSGYAKNHYDQHLSSWYAKFAAGATPDLHVRAAQAYLMYLGYASGTLDGVWGDRARSALNQFRKDHHIAPSDDLDDASFDALTAAWDAARRKP